MTGRPLESLRGLHVAHVMAAVREDRYLQDLDDYPHLRDSDEHRRMVAQRRKAQDAFYRAVDKLEDAQ